jgi:hypothetical protein
VQETDTGQTLQDITPTRGRRGWLPHLAMALAAGGALYILAFLLSGFQPLRLLVEQSGDARMQLLADYRAPTSGTTPIVFLDVDQETYGALGRPTVTPRRRWRPCWNGSRAAGPN